MQRIGEIDVLKGLLILFVVVGHAQIPSMGKSFIYWFHMPAFFIISGFLINTKKIVEPEYKMYLFKKVIKLIIPYISFLTLLVIGSIIFDLGAQEVSSFEFLGKMMFGGKLLVGQFGVFWFITCLAFTIVFYSLIERYIKGESLKIFIICALFLIGLAESYIIKQGFSIYVPFNMDTALVTVFYFYLGNKINVLVKVKPSIIFSKNFFTGTVIFSLFIIAFFHGFLSTKTLDLKYQNYQDPFTTIAFPILFIIILLGVSFLLRGKISRLFTELGKHSLTVMYLHLFIKELLINYDLYHNISFVVLGTILPLGISILLGMNPTTKLLFLGESKIFDRDISLNGFKTLIFLKLKI